jgi:tripartite-type tricarboxylate transporter receptor subunit TctC
MLVNPSLPANTVAEFIAYAKANPGKINMASRGTGSGPHTRMMPAMGWMSRINLKRR